MTIVHLVEGNLHGSLTEAVARRFRGELAERNISKTWLAQQLEVSKMWLTRRTSGRVPMSTEDLEVIERFTGISPAYLVSGIKRESPAGDDPTGQSRPSAEGGPGYAPRDLNPEPIDSGSNVVPLFGGVAA